jgi:hypothetical protein
MQDLETGMEGVPVFTSYEFNYDTIFAMEILPQFSVG